MRGKREENDYLFVNQIDSLEIVCMKNLCKGKWKAKLKCIGIIHTQTSPVISAKSSGCPRSLRRGEAKVYIGKRRMQHPKRMIQERCIYIPSM